MRRAGWHTALLLLALASHGCDDAGSIASPDEDVADSNADADMAANGAPETEELPASPTPLGASRDRLLETYATELGTDAGTVLNSLSLLVRIRYAL